LTATRATWPKPQRSEEIYTGSQIGVRREILHQAVSTVALEDGSSVRGLFVARAEAWPANEASASGEGALTRDAYVWTAGLSTWRKLAARGVWVHGSAEGLGEDDDTRLEVLAGRKVEWLRLTHQDAPNVGRHSSALATYRVEGEIPPFEALSKAKFFYWKSGTQFLAALAVCPAIANGYHATGPGHTNAAVRRGLLEAGVPAPELLRRLAVFLGESEFQKFLQMNS
jgi:hydroxymethylbilane synthase